MRINRADVAELVDARDLKFSAGPENTQTSCKTSEIDPGGLPANPAHLQNSFGRPARAKLTQIHTDKIRERINAAYRHYPNVRPVTARCDLARNQLKNIEATTDPKERHTLGVYLFQTMTELSNLLPGEK